MIRILCALFFCITAPVLYAQDAAYDRCVQEAIRSGSPAGVAACNLSRSQASMESSRRRIIRKVPSPSNSQRTVDRQSQVSRPVQTTDTPTFSNPTSKPKSRAESIVESLSGLSDMYEKGLLTEEEFRLAKRAALGLD